MRRAAIFPYLGPALVLYLIADVSAAASKTPLQEIDAFGKGLAALAILMACALLARRDPQASVPGRGRAAWLGFASGVALLSLLTPQALRPSVELAVALALSGIGALVLDLALRVPDSILPVRYRALARVLPYTLGGAVAFASVLALAPVVSPFGSPWLVPARYAYAGSTFAAACVVLAFAARVLRRRLGSAPEALASNGWAVLALAPASVLVACLAAARIWAFELDLVLLRVLGAVSALALYLGHVWLIDPTRRLAAGPALREIVTTVLAVGAVALAALPLRAHVPSAPLAFAASVGVAACVALALVRWLAPLSQLVLAPARGRLLDALHAFPETTAGVHTLSALARVELGCMRRASGAPDSTPLLYGFDPMFEARIDAAGEAHLAQRALPSAILERLRAQPFEIIVRAPLEAQIVRNPPLRPLIEALIELDALCVLPLSTDGELEGALIVPRAGRRSLLTLEELAALREHGRYLSALLAVFAAHGRIQARSQSLQAARDRAEARVERLEDDVVRLRGDVELLHGERAARAEARKLIAYSPAMRALLERLRGFASLDVPVCLLAEPGLPIEPLARVLHLESGRGTEPFLLVSCASLAAEESAAVLFGGTSGATRHTGVLRAAFGGTLVLVDVAALSLEAQRLITAALASRTARGLDGGEPYAVTSRIVFATRVPLDPLAAQGRFDLELAGRLAPVTLRVPPLRECREDLESHTLLALDRACRRLGREPLGFDPDVLGELAKQSWPDNLDELERVIDRAVASARGDRLRVAELALDAAAAVGSGLDALEGTFEDIERRALEHALTRAGGNKSEAARMLGLPRTTLLDKLRRHKLDDGTRESSSPPN